MDPRLKISRAVTKLAFNQPFFGSCLMQLKLSESEAVPTMATNGKEIFWNSKFVNELSEEQVRFVLAHEVMHVVLKHCKPWKGKDPQLCNVAMDYVINHQLYQSGFSKIEGAMYDPSGKLGVLAWEEVYKVLNDINEDKPDNQGLSDNQRESIKKDIGSAEDHVQPQNLTEAQQKELADMIDDIVVRAATQQEARDNGSLPAAVRDRLSEIRTAQIDWREALINTVKSRYPEDMSYSRPNRRHIASGLYLPTVSGESAGNLVIAVDTSGSVSTEELIAFISEVNNIINEIKPQKVYLMSADSAVANVKEYDSDCYFTDFDAVGGGGTSFLPVFEYIDKEQLAVDQLIYFSDMYVGEWDFPSKEPDFPVTWVSSGSEKAPFGEVIKIKIGV